MVQKYLNLESPSEEETKTIEHFIYFTLEQTLLLLKEHQNLELTYVENIKIDLSNMSEEKQNENMEFISDYRRICNKSLKLLIGQGLIKEKIYKMLIKTIANLYYELKKDPSTIVPDPDNTEPEYLNSIAKQQQDITTRNNLVDKLRQKIKFGFDKVDSIKAQRNNFAAVIHVHPVKVVELYNEEEEHLIENPPIIEDIKPAELNLSQDPNASQGAVESDKSKEEKSKEEIDEKKEDKPEGILLV